PKTYNHSLHDALPISLTIENIKTAINRAADDVQNGLGSIPVELKEDALEHLALAANGDMRAALNGLELAVSSTPKDKQGNIVISDRKSTRLNYSQLSM